MQTAQGVIVFDGDSLTDAAANFPAWPEMLMDAMGPLALSYHNVALASTTLQNRIAGAPTNVDPYLSGAGPVTISVIWSGTNSISLGATGAQTYAFLQQYVSDRRAAGWRAVVVSPIAARQYGPPGANAEREIFNALLAANSSFADACIPLPPEITTTDANLNGPYFRAPIDTTHLTTLGEQYVASVARLVVEPLISRLAG